MHSATRINGVLTCLCSPSSITEILCSGRFFSSSDKSSMNKNIRVFFHMEFRSFYGFFLPSVLSKDALGVLVRTYSRISSLESNVHYDTVTSVSGKTNQIL